MAAKDGPGIRLHDVEKGEEERTWSGESAPIGSRWLWELRWMSIRTDPNNPCIAAAVAWNGKPLRMDIQDGYSLRSRTRFDSIS